MANKFLENSGATPGKLVLVGILAVIFAGVMISNFTGSPSTPATTERPPRRLPGVTDVTGNNTAEPAPAVRSAALPESKDWPVVEPSSVARHNPFDLPATIREIERAKREEQERLAREREEAERLEQERQANAAVEEAARLEERLAEERAAEEARRRAEREQQAVQTLQALRASGIGIAVINGDSRVVEIGGRRLQAGDTVAGFKIVEVRADGSVILEFIDEDSADGEPLVEQCRDEECDDE